MKKWEYMVVAKDKRLTPEYQRSELNHYGILGWELVCTRESKGETLFYFKKPRETITEV